MSEFSRFSRIIWIVALAFFCTVSTAIAQEPEKEKLNISEVILHHVMDGYTWHFTDHIILPLPVIFYSTEDGLQMFSSGNFFDENHESVSYKGYKIEHSNIVSEKTGEAVKLDLSITKAVAMLFINAALLLLVFVAVAKGCRKNAGKAPKGIQSFFEPLILFVKDEIVKPNIGRGYERLAPYMLTLFFFVLFGNLLGLIPGSGNLTGNIAVTMTLALLTFILTNFSGNKNYWKHIFWTPGVPLLIRPLILLVELIGIFTKPFALMIRLFAAMTAGHIVILSLICLTFIFHSYFVGVGSSLLVVFINLIELLVAAIQAYVFTLFSSLYIGLATEDHEHH